MKTLHIFRQILFSSAWFILTMSLTATAQPDRLQNEKLLRAVNVVQSQYVDNVDLETLVEDAIKGMLRELDPHSVYL